MEKSVLQFLKFSLCSISINLFSFLHPNFTRYFLMMFTVDDRQAKQRFTFSLAF